MLMLLGLLIVVLAGLFFTIETGGSDWRILAPTGAAMAIACVLGVRLVLARWREAPETHSHWRIPNLIIVALFFLAVLGTFLNYAGGQRLALPDFFQPLAGGATLPNDNAATSVRIRKSSSGRFVTRAQLNGAPVDMLVDTGSSSILLRSSDAENAGIALAPLSFDTAVATANGTAYAAPARVRTLSVGLIRLDDVDVLVARPGSLNESLLGITFLRRLRSYEIGGDFLTLRN